MHTLLLRLIAACAVFLPAAYPMIAHARTFEAEGSDLLMGVGPQAIGMGGAVVATTGDVYASFWNPAGLLEAETAEVAVARQINAELLPVNFIGLALNPSPFTLGDYRIALGLSWIPRLHVKAEGAFASDDFASIFLRYALPGLPGDFDGKIESKTKDQRLAIAVGKSRDRHWSLGASLGRIHCRTGFCGITANDPDNYTVASTDAKAYGVNVGAKYFHAPNLTFGLHLKDLNTRLKVDMITTDKNGTRRERFVAKFPHDLSVGLAWKRSETLEATLVYQTLFGEYGNSELDFKIIRAGLEIRRHALAYRLGLMWPLVLKSDLTGDLTDDLPAPFSLTTGLGWRAGRWSLDVALYAQPVMSYERGELYPAWDVSLSYHF